MSRHKTTTIDRKDTDMARKSKETINYEKISEVSACPRDLLKYMSYTDRLLSRLSECEKGNLSEIDALSEELYTAVKESECEERCSALIYLTLKGIELGCDSCLKRLAKYICLIEDNPGVLLPYRNRLIEADHCLMCEVAVKAIIYFTSCKADFSVAECLKKLPKSQRISTEIYRVFIDGDTPSESLKESCYDEKCLSLLSLPSLYKDGTATVYAEEASSCSVDVMLEAISISRQEKWSEFWLKMLYEHARIYGGSDFTHFAKQAADIIARRKYDGKRSLHLYTFISYACDKEPSEELIARRDELKKQCLFEGLELPDGGEIDINELIKDAVYTSLENEMAQATKKRESGIIINYAKNRYYLEGELSGHGKRGKKHFWTQRFSLDKSLCKDAPIFSSFKIEEVHNLLERYGAQLGEIKGKSQIICRGELITDEQPHPFMLDLILDISYISSVKCETLELEVAGLTEANGRYIFDCTVFAS